MTKEKFHYRKILILILVFLSLFLANTSFALPDLFKPDAKDTDYLIHNILEPYFGYGDGWQNGKESPFSSFSQVFLFGLIVIAGVLLIFNIVQGITDTANTGKMLGDKAPLSWTTARVVFGVGILLPVKSGMCVIQYAILYLAAQGILLADTAWEAFAEDPYNGQVYINTSVKKQVMDNVRNVFLSEVCLQSAKINATGSSASGRPMRWEMAKKSEKVVDSVASSKFLNSGGYEYYILTSVNDVKNSNKNTYYKNTYNFGEQSVGSDNKDICGSLTIQYNEDNDINTYNIDEFLKKDFVETKNIKNNILKQQFDKTVELVEGKEVKLLVQNYLEKKDNYSYTNILDLKNKLQKIADDYVNSVYKVYKSNVKKGYDKELINLMKKDGIAAAGSWFFKLNSNMSSLEGAINSVPTITYKDNYKKTKDYNCSFFVFSCENENILKKMNPTIIADIINAKSIFEESSSMVNISNYGNIKNTSSEEEGLQDTDSKVEYAKKKLGEQLNSSGLDEILKQNIRVSDVKSTVQGVYGELTNHELNPLMQIHSLGKKIISITLYLNFGFSLVGLAVGLLPGGTGAVFTLLPLLMAIIGGLLVPGVMMAFYIPMIPFMLWIGALFGWIVLVVEAIFGAPMWAVSFIVPDRNGFVGRQGQGYMLILSLALRPILMILGYIAALTLLTPMFLLMNNFIGFLLESLIASETDLFIKFFYNAFLLIIYCIMVNKTVIQIFELIHKVPDTLLKWMNMGGEQLGVYAKGIEGSVSSAAIGAMMATKGVSDAFSNTGKNIDDSMRDKRMRREGELQNDLNSYLNSPDNQEMNNMLDKAFKGVSDNFEDNMQNNIDGAEDWQKGMDGQKQKNIMATMRKVGGLTKDLQKYQAALDSMNTNGAKDIDVGGGARVTKQEASNKIMELKEKINNEAKNALGNNFSVIGDDGKLNIDAMQTFVRHLRNEGIK